MASEDDARGCWGMFFLLATLIVIPACLYVNCNRPEPPPRVVPPKPTAEERGERAGQATAGFGKGFIAGFRDGLRGGESK